MAASKAANEPIYQIKVTLRDSRPPIWRRIQVPGAISLYELHHILQIVMGWGNYHLYQFLVGGRSGRTYYGEPESDFPGEIESARTARLNRIAPGEKARFIYEYDFGDSWEHDILVEKIRPAEPGVRYPVCLAGKRACPPEDCGGVWGYAKLLETIRNPDDPEYESTLEWLGDSFDPEAFDLDAVNRAL